MLIGVSFVSPMSDCNILLDHIHSSILDDSQFVVVSPFSHLNLLFFILVLVFVSRPSCENPVAYGEGLAFVIPPDNQNIGSFVGGLVIVLHSKECIMDLV